MNPRSCIRRVSFCVAVVLTALPALSVAGQTVDEVLGHVRAATGREAFAAKPQGVQLTGSGTLAGNDTVFSFILDPAGRFVQAIDGPISITTAFDGETAWSKDLGGEVRTLELGDRAQAVLMGAIFSGQWLTPESPLILTLNADASTDASVRLDFISREGVETGHVDIDRATWLPTRWAFSGATAEQSLVLSGSRTHDGITFPARFVRASDNGTEVTLDVQSIADAPMFIRSPYARPPGASDARFDPAIPAALEVKKSPTGHLLVHPSVNGKDLGWFIFDTGAGANVLTTRVADELKLSTIGVVPAVGIGGAVESRLVRADSLVLGPMTMDRPVAIVMDLSFLDQYMGTPIAGIVGYGLLSRAVLDIDMVTPALALYDAAHPDPAITEWRKLYIYERIPCVDAKFEGHDGIFKLDTGAGKSTVSFHVPAVQKLKLLENRETTPTVQGGVGSMVAARAGQLAWFEIAGRRHEKVDVVFSTAGKGAFADAYTAGNLGGGFLSDFRLIMDYQNGRIAYVPRGPAPGK